MEFKATNMSEVAQIIMDHEHEEHNEIQVHKEANGYKIVIK